MKVMVTGTFDGLHPGHLYYFTQARTFADYLSVVVARDSTVEKEKGKMPVIRENDRLALIKSLRIVDYAVLGNKKDKLKTVEQLRPDVICLGYDQQVDEKQLQIELARRGVIVRIERISPYNATEYKSRNLHW